ncbi:LysR family transcriptional regulator [Peptoniphilus sp. SGI.035]|uniref:LysR family transcriptional regulator n=1 Tax=Peptoniphilus sp. SGI.035 TaxID=3420564 RepID=UPI003D0918A3
MIFKEKNITKASEKLYVSQPALSSYLIRLEEEIGCKLFTRDKNGLNLTSIGKDYLNYLEEIKRLDDEFNLKVSKYKKTSSFPKEINFGITPWIGAYITSNITSEFNKTFPNTKINFTEGEGYVLLDYYMNNKIDSFISIDVISRKINTKTTSSFELRNDKIFIIISESNVYGLKPNTLDNPYKIDADLLSNKNIIFGQKTQALYTCAKNIISYYKLEPNSAMYFKNINNILELAKSGNGIAFIPKYYIQKGPNIDNCLFFTEENELFDYKRMFFYRNNEFKIFYEEFGRLLKSIFEKL